MDHSNPDDYLVTMYDEVNMLSNVLMAICIFKKRCGEMWPIAVVVHKYNRLTMGLGHDTTVKHGNGFFILDCIYLSQFQPLVDKHNNKRTATRFRGKRTPIGKAFLNRVDLLSY